MRTTRFAQIAFATLLATTAFVTTTRADEEISTGPRIYTGGKTGNYFLSFGPQVKAVADKATWNTFVVTSTDGTPANMKLVAGNPEGVGEFQGNVWGELGSQPEYSNVHIVKDTGNKEIVFAVVTKLVYERSQGNWPAIAGKHTLRIVTSSETSGPGRTLKQFLNMDPRLQGANVTYVKDMDTALAMVANGQADVALNVQFADPDNPRFGFIKEHGLKVVGILFPEMKKLQIIGLEGGDKPAFELCDNVTVGFSGGLKIFGNQLGGDAVTIRTACTPLLIGVNTAAAEDLVQGLKDAPVDEFLPPKGSNFRNLFDKVTVTSGDAWASIVNQATELGGKIGNNM